MRLPESPSMLAMALVPALTLVVFGSLWLYKRKAVPEIPATLVSAGVALMTLFVLAVATRATSELQPYSDSAAVLFGGPLAGYVLVLVLFSQRQGVRMPGMLLCGIVGLLPTYYLAGFTVIMTVCSFGAGGC